MQKITFCGAFLLLGLIANAQQQPAPKPAQDTLVRKDSALLEEIKDNVLDNIPVVSLDESDLSDGSAQNVSSVLTAGRDPFFSAAAFSFSPLRFRIRGYDADWNTTLMNGIPVDNLDNGFTPWGLWGGLNDVMRNRDVSVGLRSNTFAFGDLGTTTNLDSRASKQRKQTNIGYAISNRNYNHRISITHSTGVSKKGWAFTFSGSFRGADEGYVPGTYYNSFSYFVAVDKRINQKHLLSFTAFGAPTENGRQGAAVQEAMDLTGSNYYNPNWGYQNGKKRNASVAKTHQPFLILTHDFRINNKTNLVTAVGYSFGERAVSALDWYNTADPRPDYYRYLPSYQTDLNQQAQVIDAWRNNPSVSQVNWDRLYDVNRNSTETIRNVGGIQGNNISGRRSRYIIEDRVIDTRRFNFNTVLNSQVTKHMEFMSGISFQHQKNNYFKRINDLLGGDFYVNLNQFAERDFPNNPTANQFDINSPNRVLYKGDRYGWDYDIDVTRYAGWAQSVFRYNHWDFFIAGELSQTSFYREGKNRNGLFPNNSFGKSATQNFTNYSVKGGFTYKLDGRNYFYMNGAYMTRAPFFENVFISARSRDVVQDDITSEKVQSIEGGYILNAPQLKVRLTGYYTRFQDAMNVISFYHDDFRNLVNYAINGIDRNHFGGEFGFDWKAFRNVNITGAASVGRYFFSSRQNAVVTLDNDASVLQRTTVYAENFRVGSTPQEAYNLGITYRSPKFWFASLTANYFDQMWLEFNPIRRTSSAVDGLDLTKPGDVNTYYQIINQTQWKPQYTLDFFFGYSYKLPRSMGLKKPTFLIFNVGINNLTNNQTMVTGGFEQLRFDFEGQNVNRFPPRLFYAYGINYFGSISLRF
jgi:hypothetical protein